MLTVRNFAARKAPAVAEDFCARVEQRLAERGQESSAPVDEALQAHVAALEEQLVALSGKVREQRDAVPRWAVQRLEEGQAGVLGQLLALGNTSDDELVAGGGKERAAALTTEVTLLNEQRQLWEETQQRMGASATSVQQALDDATRAQQQVAAAKSLPVTSIDAAIASTGKENAAGTAPSRWRRNVQLQMMPPTKRACV